MIEYIGLAGLIAIVCSMAIIYLRRRQKENALRSFYQDIHLAATNNAPQNIREILNAPENLFCREGILTTPAGGQIPFFWWEWFFKSYRPVSRGSSDHYDFYLAVSFAPQTVSNDFMQKAIDSTRKTNSSAAQSIKDLFSPEIKRPIRAEKLADGSFLICWQILKDRKIYEAKLAWLNANVSGP